MIVLNINSQTLILLFGLLGYFVKRFFDFKTKKLEINHSLIQQNRINAVSTFLLDYSKTVLMWQQLSVYKILTNELSVAEIDSIILTPLNDLKRSVLVLRIYFDGEMQDNLEKILEGFLSVNQFLSNEYFSIGHNSTISNKANAFHTKKEKILCENDILLTSFCIGIREIYKS